MQADLAAFMKLPPGPYDACDKVNTRISSLSLVRYKNNDYSTPTRYRHQEVLAKGYVDRVEIVCRDETIAVHPRSYVTADFIYNPLHYLGVVRTKDQGARPGGTFPLILFWSFVIVGVLIKRRGRALRNPGPPRPASAHASAL
jgi:hypothetical protein